MRNILEIKNLVVSYGGIEAVKGIDLTVEEGKIVTLIGSNGAGKSTTLKAVAGLVRPKSGEILLNDANLVGKSTDQIVSSGVTLVPEGRRVFSNLTVAENLRIGAYLRKDSLADDLARVYDLFPRLKEREKQVAGTLSGGESQRIRLASQIGSGLTGVLYVLDEPSIGLHPSNIVGLTGVMHDLIDDGNSVLLVDHDTQILSEADWLIEMGPEAGAKGGHVIAEGTTDDIKINENSQIGPFLAGKQGISRQKAPESELFQNGAIHLSTDRIHTVKPLEADIPKGRLTVVTGVSGSGKTTLILESLIPALSAHIRGEKLPAHVKSVSAEGIDQAKLIDATPIGINVRSTVATYANVHDELRKIFARTPDAKKSKYKAGDFSYNTGKLRCPTCDGTGSISLDVQFLPDVNIPCPDCRGSRYGKDASKIRCVTKSGEAYTLPEIMDMDVRTALSACKDWKLVSQRLNVLNSLGLGYLTLGEETPGLSGGEAQRLKLASEMGKAQSGSVFVFDEPTIGLHPLDVQTLLTVFQTLIESGATVIVIEHDLDVIRSADYILDMGPGGGEAGGRLVACGTPEQIKNAADSVTGKFI